MKVATSSTTFDRLISAGDLTQLEWLDWCATTLPADGVVLDHRHFPRTDADYIAQVKKLATDLGLAIAGLRSDDLFEGPDAAFAIASAVGAPLIVTQSSPARDDPQAWTAFVTGAGQVAATAKQANIPLAVRMRADTLTPDAAALKRFAKDVDSAWLRFAVDPASTSETDPVQGILPRSIIAVHESVELDAFGADVNADISGAVRELTSFRGFFALDYVGEGDVRACISTQLTWLRTMLAKETLDRHA